LQLFGGLLWVEAGHAGDVSARPLQARHHVVRHRIDHDSEYDRNVRRRFLGGASRHGSGHCQDVHFQSDQLSNEFRKALVLAFRESWLDHHIAAFDIAKIGKPLPECVQEGQRTALRREKSNLRDFGRLLSLARRKDRARD